MTVQTHNKFNGFKGYGEKYYNSYVVEFYKRHKDFDTVCGTFKTLKDATQFMEDNDLNDGNRIFYIDGNGNAYEQQK